MADKSAVEGRGHFHWNSGGWFGGQIGSSGWILLAGVLLAFKSLMVGLILIAAFAMINTLGTLLWCRRDRIAPYAAVQCLILLNGAFAFFIVILIDHLGHIAGLDPRYSGIPVSVYAMLFMFPTMMLSFHLMERGALRRRQEES